MYAQGYFVYDSHKSGAQTVSHLRFGPRPIHAPYLIESANFVACHQFELSRARIDVLRLAAPGATFLLNSPYGPDEVWDHLPRSVQQQILDQEAALLRDRRVQGRARGRAGRPHQHRAADLLLRDLGRAAARRRRSRSIKHVDRQELRRQGRRRRAQELRGGRRHAGASVRGRAFRTRRPAALVQLPLVPDNAPAFVREVTAQMMEGRGDEIRSSQMPVDGTFPSGTAACEKRNIADIVAGLGSGPLHPVRPVQLRLPAQRDPRASTTTSASSTARRPASSRRRSTRAAIPTCASRCSSTSRTAPAAASASRPVPVAARASPGVKAINLRGQGADPGRRSAPTSPSSRRCR